MRKVESRCQRALILCVCARMKKGMSALCRHGQQCNRSLTHPLLLFSRMFEKSCFDVNQLHKCVSSVDRLAIATPIWS